MNDHPKIETSRLHWEKTNPDMAKLIMERADVYLSAQLSTGFAADQRATTLASVLVVLATTVFGAATTDWADTAMSVGAIVSGLIFLGAAWIALSAAQPVDFYFNGAHPEQWWAVRRHKIEEVVGIETENLQEAIDFNSDILSKNAAKIIAASRLAVAAPAMGLVTWMFLFYLEDFFQALVTAS